MNDNLHIIFAGDDCPSFEQLLTYFHGELTGEERHRIERHLTDCEMCSDELEGLSKMKDPGKLPEIIADIQSRAFKGKGRIIQMNYRIILSAAAAIVILIVGSVFLFRYITVKEKEPVIAQTMEMPAQPGLSKVPPPPAPKEAETQKSAMTGQDKRKELKPGKGLQEKGVEEVEVTADQAAPEMEVISRDEAAVKPAEKKEAQDNVAGVAPSVVTDSFRFSLVMEEKQAPEAVKKDLFRASSKQQSTPVLIDSAMIFFHQDDYANAARLFELVLVAQPRNSSALYHLAACYIQLKEYAKARPCLEKILADPGDIYYQESMVLMKKVESAPDTNRPK